MNLSKKKYYNPLEESFKIMNHLLETNEKDKDFPVDIMDLENGFKIEAELPGFEKQEMKISLENNHLTIFAKNESREKKRVFKIAEAISIEDINASLKNGILTISLNKLNPKPAKKITIQ